MEGNPTAPAVRKRVLMTGSPFYTREIQAVALPRDRWQASIIDPTSVPNRWLRTFRLGLGLWRTDIWYSTGGVSNARMEWGVRAAVALGTPTVIHWIGTDVLEAGAYFATRRTFLHLVATRLEHWATSPGLVAELGDIGIPATFVPRTSLKRRAYLSQSLPALSSEFTIVTSIDPERPEFYGWPLIRRLALELPDVRVIVIRASQEDLPDVPTNVQCLGWVTDTLEVYLQATVAVRMTRHDGYSGSILEPLALGRHAIWTHPFPGCLLARDYSDLLAHVIELLRRHRDGTLRANLTGRAYIAEHLAPDALSSNLERGLRRLCV